MYYTLIITLIAICFGSCGATYFALQEHYLVACFLLIFVGYMLYIVLENFSKSLKKIQLVSEAMKNKDYSFHFHTHKWHPYNRAFNKVLNEIKDVLAIAQLEIEERERYHQIILEKIKTGVMVVNTDGHILLRNEAASKLLGLDILTHIQQLTRISPELPSTILISKEDKRTQLQFENELGMQTLSIDIKQINTNHETIKIITINSIGSELDIHEIEAWSKLTRVLTHEIMNSLSPVMSLSQHILTNETLNKDVRPYIEMIHSNTKLISEFTSSYHQLSSISSPRKEIFSLEEFFKLEIKAISVDLDYSYPIHFNQEAKDILIYADRLQISQVVKNILKNAIQAVSTHAQPSIEIAVFQGEAEEIIISFKNNGTQITPEIAQQIFIPFFTTKEQGSGIGLSLAKQIMKLHDGNLKLSYSTPTQTEFLLTFY